MKTNRNVYAKLSIFGQFMGYVVAATTNHDDQSPPNPRLIIIVHEIRTASPFAPWL
ncbi:hypothetical protein FRACYDRAFT_270475 [Fragilariopsis cylindrus CCMP1102]|uniref:Uncharacterized protein n=1 Tax=Fragilariopsis cylindrus CCMP1102 TaxID=635003 RepID=A0A1E7F3R8_9STRA|nr:hypothetical protein FRACYDRAFT_270475 [Fragilariopsis cylindrus CCMP1102]|eukprot:OEU12776.1 hypothetical protein FRACYDRAFT_270475 [Fragilariopsis cylindrus CCMP1102]